MGESAQERYEQEQAQLQAKQEGDGDLHIDVPKEPEVDPKVYKDVEAILYRGFLHVPAEINGVQLVFKSLNHHEYSMLQLRHRREDKAFYDLFLAYGVLFVAGSNVLRDRDRWVPDLSSTFAGMPDKAKGKVVRLLWDLNRRVAGAVTLTEAYAMERYSRFRWIQLRGLDLCSPTVTGIPGTEILGLNWGQLLWRALNVYEDNREEAERAWDNAKFIGSCMAGKGISKIYAQDRERHRKELEYRIARKDALFQHVLLGKPLDNGGDQRPGEVMVVAKSVDELASQLERSLKGEQDWHDEVVSAIEDRARRKEQERQQHLQQIVHKHDEEWGSRHNVVGGTDLEGIRPQDVGERVARRRQEIDRSMSQMRDPRIEESLEKWLGEEEPPMAPVRRK